MLDIQQIDYRIQGFQKRKVENSKGDIATVEYYQTYDPLTDTGTNLKVRESRAFTRDQNLGIPYINTVEIEWFRSDKTTPRATKTLIKPLNQSDGIKANCSSRSRLITNAKVKALELLGLEAGLAFLQSVSLEVSTYKEGDIEPLITAITNSGETQAFKDAMTGILNVSYIPT
jgi:hypothetical protein